MSESTGKSARWIGHLIQRAQPQLLLHWNAATSPHGHCVNVADSNRADLNCDGSLEGDPFFVARTVLKLSNGVAAARPPFKKTAACKVFKHDPARYL